MKEAIFSLLKLGVEIAQPQQINISVFPCLDKSDWDSLRLKFEAQGVDAIAADGLNKLLSTFGKEVIAPNIDPGWWQQFLCEWIGSLLIVESVNNEHTIISEKLAQKWSENSIRVMIMKGQANGSFYPHPEHRNPGDIDCYLFGDYEKGNDIARQLRLYVDESWYKHSEIVYSDVVFENHLYFVTTRGGEKSKSLERELEDALKVDESLFKELTKNTKQPPVQWTAMFLTYHACSHFLSEGLRLKQLLDWAMFLKKHEDNVDWDAFYKFCERYNYINFVDGITSISQSYLSLQIINEKIRTQSSYTERILDSILYDDDYIYSEGERGLKEKLHVIRNLFRYRWKYEEIYEESVWKKLWHYATGYLFKTER